LRPFTARELNRATLARQLLLERSRLSVPAAVERLGAMQAQWPPAPYIGLWTRLESFRLEQLTAALELKRVTRSTLFRMTVHLVSAKDQPAFARLVHDQWRSDFDAEGLAVEELQARIERLAADGLFTYADLNAVLPELEPRGFRVRCLTPLVHVPPSGTWGKVRIRLTTADRWLGAPKPSAEEAAERLIRSYLRAFGPASRADLLQFSGLRVAALDPTLDRLRPSLTRREAEDGRELLDLPRAPRPDPKVPAPVRFLPPFDAILLSHRDRTRVLPEEYRSRVIRGGDVRPTFLVDGLVAGEWQREGERVKVEPYAPLPASVRREVDGEARRLAAFLASG
jgi:winged helix DNA-binding protein